MKRRALKVRLGNYGLMGMCEEWLIFEPFRDWSLGNGYANDLELDRIDNEKGYAPDNCRWVTSQVNTNNRRNTRRFEAFGETKPIAEWARDPRCAVKESTLFNRVMFYGWHGEAALTTPRQMRGRWV